MAGEGMIYDCNGIHATFSIDFDFELTSVGAYLAHRVVQYLDLLFGVVSSNDDWDG